MTFLPAPLFVSLVFSLISSLVFSPSAHAAPDAHPFANQPLPSKTTKISEHVWAIDGFPNIGLIIGTKSTLVVDTGLGRTNGETVAKAAKKLAPHNRLYVTTTHFHPEHAGGILGFPSDTLLLRNRAQQDEMKEFGEAMVERFASRNDLYKGWLKGEQLRDPDLVFEKEMSIDLGGGVIARLLHFGPAHTRGDEVVFVDPDKTLISGDVVQNHVEPSIYKQGGSLTTWIGVVEQIEKLGAKHVLPDHSTLGDGSLVTQEKTLLTELREKTLAQKKQGVSAADAVAKIKEAFEKEHPDVAPADMTEVVRATYAE